MKNIVLSLSLVLFVIFIQCKNSKNQNQPIDSLKVKAENALGEGTDCSTNGTSTHILCQVATPLEQGPGSYVSFHIYEIKTGDLIYSEEISNGTVKWATDQSVEIFLTPGIMGANQTPDDYTYIYDLTTKTKTKKKKG